jgi:hypothetical protein
LIDSGDRGGASGVAIVHFDDVQAVKMEARAFEARHGKNPYSDFILIHGRRPDKSETAGMGRMMNLRLRAADGSLQPKLTKADNAAHRCFQHQQAEARRKHSEVRRLREAIRNIAATSISPGELAGEGNPIREHAEIALEYLRRFVEELRGDKAGKPTCST